MTGKWIERGFEDFADGTFGNGGHNLNVSCRGVLQRIHQYDLTGSGYVDLIFCNSQNHCERPPAFVYADPLGEISRIDLPSDGSRSGVVADLNGDGFDDLVLGMYSNGIRTDLNAIIYLGSHEGFSERRTQQLPAPLCTSVAVGDLNGDGRLDLAFLASGTVRMFYQSGFGFEPKRFVDLAVEGDQLAAGDLDSYIYWNRPGRGFSAADRTRLFAHSASGWVGRLGRRLPQGRGGPCGTLFALVERTGRPGRRE